MRAQRTPPRDFYQASHLCLADDFANRLKILAEMLAGEPPRLLR
jgi:hypothetical protein